MTLRHRKPFSGLMTRVLVGLLTVHVAIPALATHPDPDGIQQRGDVAYHSGNFESALQHWNDAAAIYADNRNHRNRCTTLQKAAAAEQALGRTRAASRLLEQAREAASLSGESRILADVLGQLGDAYLQESNLAEAETLLRDALALAREQKAVMLEGGILESLASLHQRQGNLPSALDNYQEAMRLAEQAGDHALNARAATSAGQLALESNQHPLAKSALARALHSTKQLPDSHDKIFLLIRIARLQSRTAAAMPEYSAELSASAQRALVEAAAIATGQNNPRAASWALGHLGEIYEDRGRNAEALDLTRRAIFSIQDLHVPEILFRWQWQKARLLRKSGKPVEATKAYQDAIASLQSVSSELAASMLRSRRSYHNLVGPLYIEYADLLFQHAGTTDQSEAAQNTLLEARNTLELLKSVELQDYFQDDCLSLARSRTMDLEEAISDKTAVIYPVLFPDRTDLLLSTSKGLFRHSVPVTADQMTSEARNFRLNLEKRTTRQYLRPAQRLYDWLIRPVEAELANNGIDTLVIVPDAALRAIPLAALHDGQQFLIQKYALASTPSLELTDPRPIRTENTELLLNGLTKPVQGFPALPAVSDELEMIQSMYGGKVLKDTDFSTAAFQEQISGHAYNIVHIASHGKFKGKVSDSFILTYDGKLTMSDLERYIGLSLLRVDKPVELLTLSACQTAAGDDWAGLGLASVAIKAGARSALATLWYINDRNAAELVASFYRHLGEPGMTKAKALQQAQLETLDKLRYRHPAYWAPYLLIGNWL